MPMAYELASDTYYGLGVVTDLPEAVPQALPQSNALSGEKNKKPQLCLSVVLVTFASAFVVCRHPIS